MARKGERLGFEMIKEPVTITGGVMKGVAAAFSLAPDCHVILTATSLDSLKRAWMLLTARGMEESNTAEVCQTLISPLEGADLHDSHDSEIHWIYWEGSNSASMLTIAQAKGSNNEFVDLGLAVKKSEVEGKILLRAYGLSRQKIETVFLVDFEIPF